MCAYQDPIWRQCMKKFGKIMVIVLALATLVGACFAFAACNNNDDTIVVYTNAFFAPFEYYEGTEIVGVDIDIMNKVGERMGRDVEFKNVEFGIIIDEVSSGKMCDVGAAGITWTEERAEKVAFSVPYYKSVQYVIFAEGSLPVSKNADGDDIVMWSALAGKKIGVQLDTTGDIYVGLEIDGEEGYTGAIQNTGATKVQYKNAQLAVESLGTQLDVVVVDELPAQYLTKNGNYVALPLYYDAETATEEEYCIAVNKGQTELLENINAVLNEMMAELNEDGDNAIEALVKQHFGL